MMGEPKVADFPNIYLGGKNGSLVGYSFYFNPDIVPLLTNQILFI